MSPSEEGAGKFTIVRALLPHTPSGARIDAEDIGQTNPCPIDDQFFDLLRRNVGGLVENFWWAGYVNVVAGSFLRNYPDYLASRQLLARPATVFLVELLVAEDVRDRRRVTRSKRTTREWRDMAGRIPEDNNTAAARYIAPGSADAYAMIARPAPALALRPRAARREDHRPVDSDAGARSSSGYRTIEMHAGVKKRSQKPAASGLKDSKSTEHRS